MSIIACICLILESEFTHHFSWSLKIPWYSILGYFHLCDSLARLQLWNILGKWSKHKIGAKISWYTIYGEKSQQNVPFPTMTRGFSAYWMRSMASFILSGSASVLGGSRHLTLGLNQTSMKYPEAIHLSKFVSDVNGFQKKLIWYTKNIQISR